jgi:hypothetical protein
VKFLDTYGEFIIGIKKDAAFTGHVMRGDNVVAEINEDKITDITDSAPLYLKHRRDFVGWLNERGADLTRSNMRSILKQLRLPLTNIRKAVEYVHAVSIVDSFWIKGSSSPLTYSDVSYKNNHYFKAALTGDPDVYELPVDATPEITNIGSFNKGWKRKDDAWYLYKTGTALELFSELFTSKLALLLKLDAVKYSIEDGFIVSRNFVMDGWDFEPAASVIGDDVTYSTGIKLAEKYNVVKEYMDIIFMDAIVRNGDRHEFNYGFLTNADGQIKMAPNFDNNLALFSTGIPSSLKRGDVLVTDFISILPKVSYEVPKVTEAIITEAYKSTIAEIKVDVPENTVVEFCMNAYTQITEGNARSDKHER